MASEEGGAQGELCTHECTKTSTWWIDKQIVFLQLTVIAAWERQVIIMWRIKNGRVTVPSPLPPPPIHLYCFVANHSISRCVQHVYKNNDIVRFETYVVCGISSGRGDTFGVAFVSCASNLCSISPQEH
jgi:hypothetical protein